ncbi:MAG: phosphoglucomutase/phosphomannomutase family protein [Candidatus Omnitrophota bacterium]|nr:MAG: phosphoglucomutase/phosphomannomutase family protein [Candidatus Omnitrophota bacterium]
MKEIRFGTDGWRAEIARDFTFENVEIVAQAIADYFNKQTDKQKGRRIVIGYDTRFLSKEFAQTVSRVLLANGIEVLMSASSCPTPALSFTIVRSKARGGVMITASHNPFYFNGIKIKGDFGGSVDTEVTKQIEGLLGKNKPKKLTESKVREYADLKIKNFLPAYKRFVSSYVDFNLIRSSRKRWRILVDSMFGTGNGIIEELLTPAGIKVETIRREANPAFPGINPEPIPANLKQTIDLVKRGGYDLAVITDGDADRIGALRPDGKFITPSLILSLILLHFLRHRRWKGGVVKTISSSSLIEKITQRYNLNLYETPIGFKHIATLMRKEDILIGGEESGGIGYKNYLFERDGILSALLLIEMLCAEKKGVIEVIKEIEKEFGRFRYARIDIFYPQDKKQILINRLKTISFQELLGKKVREVKRYDGVKIICEDDSWLLLRFSGTEPILRIYAEASSEREAREMLRKGKEMVYRI